MSTINAGQSLQRFTQDKWYAYSGIVQGDITVPASITLIDIPNTGLKNAFVKIQPSYGEPTVTSGGNALGISISIDGIEVVKSQLSDPNDRTEVVEYELFIPRQSRLEVISLNKAANNTQERGVTVLGWYV